MQTCDIILRQFAVDCDTVERVCLQRARTADWSRSWSAPGLSTTARARWEVGGWNGGRGPPGVGAPPRRPPSVTAAPPWLRRAFTFTVEARPDGAIIVYRVRFRDANLFVDDLLRMVE